ncbi:TetR/AcrR family transcriptional regulator [Aestuariicella hydrocarbonica]|uniref:TetR/AcrR family transcriptional regulator n=1 Tax=Pseudomaricurvus hydrocarbonicus TaxID=1470433 RepID=A0A9E5JTL4_9GAMM|nr:TetR/AcrR family transcriptional regulator [Aestuariicella hydrocarbonica]NHO65338.1 TetR/AcrR family transcriptional regulator [Aestuariicella hydrocarbonica]
MDKAKQKVQQFRQREQAILDTALELLIEHGEDKVTVEQIAARVDIGKGTIYKHFTSKTEIYIRLLFDYEHQLKADMDQAIIQAEAGDYSAPARVYFEKRMSDPVRARLFQRLEEKMVANGEEKEKLQELEDIRQEALVNLNKSFANRIQEGRLIKDVPPYYYYLAYWALTHGAVELYHNHSFHDLIADKPDFMKFIMDLGVHMGVKTP